MLLRKWLLGQRWRWVWPRSVVSVVQDKTRVAEQEEVERVEGGLAAKEKEAKKAEGMVSEGGVPVVPKRVRLAVQVVHRARLVCHHRTHSSHAQRSPKCSRANMLPQR